MANVVKLKRGSGSDPSASDMVVGEPVIRTDTAELFFKKDDGSVAKVSGGGGGPDFKYLELRNAANNGAASYPGNDFTLVSAGTTTAVSPAAANTLLLSVSGVIQKPNSGTSTSGITGFIVDGSRLKWATNIPAAPDFILYQESGGIGEPSDETVGEDKLKVSNSPVNGYFLSAQSGNTGGLTWAAPVATSCTGNSATATALATARAINGVNFDGTAAITVTAAAGTLSGNTLNSSVVTSSLTSLGDLAGLTVDGDATFTGANYNVLWDKSDNALEFADNAKLRLGTGNDLEIYHDGSQSIIKDNGTGQLLISGENTIAFTNADQSENYLRLLKDGAVELYYDNSKKFETTSAGVSFANGADATTSKLLLALGNSSSKEATIQGISDSTNEKGIEFKTYSFAPKTPLTLTHDGQLKVPDNSRLKMGTSDDLQIYHSGSHSFVEDTGTGSLKVRGSVVDISATNAANMVLATEGSSVNLYFDGAKKLETTSDGATITGNLKPDADSTRFLGSNGVRFSKVFADVYEGSGANLTNIPTTTINNNADNRVITGSGTANTLNGESNVVIDSSSRLILGTAGASRNVGDVTSQMQVEGTGFASSSLSLISNAGASAGNTPHITMGKSRGSSVGSNTIVADGDALGQFQFAGADGTDCNSVACNILGRVDGTPGSNDMPGALTFGTAADGAASPTERMRIDSSGNVGIGTTSPSTKLHVAGSGNQFIYLNNTTTSDGFYFKAGTGASSIQTSGGSNIINFFTSGSERLRIQSSGGISFNGDTAAANALDDFEEGTFTPTNATVGLQSSYTYGYYQKVGDWVTVQFGVRFNNNGSAIATHIDGLPFNMTADQNGTNTNSFAIGYHNGNHIQFALGNSGDRIFVYDKNGNTVQLTHMDNDYIRIFGTYKTS